jgi:hypothetical protein
MSNSNYTETLDDFCVEIDKAIQTLMSEDVDAPVEEAIREVVEGMILGEDPETQDEIRRRYRI